MNADPHPSLPDRNLALELVRVTEAAALAAAPLVGSGDKEEADQAAVDGMRYMLQSVQMDGVVVIGEGEKDEAPMLYNGEQIGDGSPPEVDIAVDPLEGTTLAANGMPSALAVIALSARGTMFDPGPCVYMEKLAGAPEIADLLDLDRPLGETVKLIAERRRCPLSDVMVVVLDRPRHEQGIAAIRAAGARVRLIPHGDVSAALLAVTERSPVDLLWGIGGTPEGVISAAAVKCVGGQLLGRLWPRDDVERDAALEAGYDLEKVLDRDDLVAGEDVFFSATGITDGDVLQGVRYPSAGGATTESLVTRTRSGTIRRIRATHDRSKLRAVGGERF
ncbi:MAG: fructose,6-bisphosphatase [Solirubrobacteraceae bacterium]|nr:fructose,6-bisphosphatase, class [Solirubrobacterales bacterium]MEA2216799.1 fructose,6-bisphosphatase [Solirubrobacteraceae bacterium]